MVDLKPLVQYVSVEVTLLTIGDKVVINKRNK